MNQISKTILIASILLSPILSFTAKAAERFIVVASTTSTVNSGLFDFLLPKFTQKSGLEIRVVGVGTGQALRVARRGDADVLFVHHKKSEMTFVKDGFGVKRSDVMFNEFVIVGPSDDPAHVGGIKTAAAGYKAIATKKSIFVSRGDDSGTHKKSLEIWHSALSAKPGANARWYREAGSGMGATLNITSSMQAYTLTDRATWENFKNKGDLKILLERDPALQNQYGIIKVNPARHSHVKSKEADMFITWLLSAEAQTLINAYRINGKQVFFANARN